MIRRLRAFYNPWFNIPFLLWALLGSVLLLIFDRRALFSTVNLHHNHFGDVMMYYLSIIGSDGVTFILLGLLLFKSCRNWWYVIAAVVCNAVPALLIQALKAIFHVARPLKYYEQTGDIKWIHFDASWGSMLTGDNSFPSGHSGGIFSLCCFLSLILPKHRSAWGIGLLLFALLVGYSRMYLAAHFFADVFAGSMVGTTTTLFCFALMRRWSNQSFTIVTRRSTFN